MDAKQACDKLNGFNFQNRYLVGKGHSVRRHKHHPTFVICLLYADG